MTTEPSEMKIELHNALTMQRYDSVIIANKAPYIIKFEGVYYRFVSYMVQTACYEAAEVWQHVRVRGERKPYMPELDKARLEDSDGQLYAIVHLDTTSGAPRVLIFKGKCFQFINYGSSIQVPTYKECAWEMLNDDREAK